MSNRGDSASSVLMKSDPGLPVLLTSIFKSWDAAGILFLVLRNYENLPEATTNDVDVLIADEQFGLAEKVMVESAERCGYLLHNRVEFATISYFFHHPETLRQIQIDIFTKTQWHCFELLDTHGVLKRRIQRPLFSIPSPVDEGLISLLSRLIYIGQARDKYRDRIHAGFASDPGLATRLLAKTFGSSASVRVVGCCIARRWEEVESLAAALRKRLILRSVFLHPFRTLGALASAAARFAGRVIYPGGVVIAVMGVDGSGKSTVAKHAIDMLRNTFSPGKMMEVHWKPVVFLRGRRKGTGAPNVDPHGRPPRSRGQSLAYLFFHWLEYIIGSHFHFRAVTFVNGLVLVDRYYHDFLVDQRRYRLNVPPSLIRFLGRFVKAPDLVFLFDAPTEVLRSRKQEVTPEETARQREAFLEVANKLRNTTIMDASKPIGHLASEMTALILKHMRNRMNARRDRS